MITRDYTSGGCGRTISTSCVVTAGGRHGGANPTSGPRRQVRPADSAITHQRAGGYTVAAMTAVDDGMPAVTSASVVLALDLDLGSGEPPPDLPHARPDCVECAGRYESGDPALGHVAGIAILARVPPGQLDGDALLLQHLHQRAADRPAAFEGDPSDLGHGRTH
jgi:hypothetical protein